MILSLGDWDDRKAGFDRGYFDLRHCVIDCRGRLQISPKSYWGYENMVITWSHRIESGLFSVVVKDSPVTVDDYAFITSRCVLYDCHIMHHAIVAVGSVVSRIVVPPYTIVAGNPAKVVAKWNGKEWAEIKHHAKRRNPNW